MSNGPLDGATPVIRAKTKKSAAEFMKFLHAGMGPPSVTALQDLPTGGD